MPVQPLPQVPNGTNLFIDANILVSAIGGRSAQCLAFLERCSREEVTGVCSYSVFLDVVHQFMVAEARAKGHIPAGQNNPAKYLKRHPAIIIALQDYWVEARRAFALNLLFLDMEENILRQAHVERQAAGLLTTDSVIVAFMREYGIEALASGDSDFDRVNGIQVFAPTDLA
jgi:predicted nucleic acid-binding protein